jgi:hypothetical protein
MDKDRLAILEARHYVREARFPNVNRENALTVLRAAGRQATISSHDYSGFLDGRACYPSDILKAARAEVSDPAATAADRQEALEDLRLRATGRQDYGMPEDRLRILLARNRARRAGTYHAIPVADALEVLRAAGLAVLHTGIDSAWAYEIGDQKYTATDLRRMARKAAKDQATADAAEALAAIRSYLYPVPAAVGGGT